VAYRKIKLTGTRKNKEKGFYIMLNHTLKSDNVVYSSKINEFLVERRCLKKLDEAGIKYKQLEVS